LTDRCAAAAGIDDGVGYFLYERTHSDDCVAVIARLHSEEAALKLSHLLGME
jgi:hypothetical protein